MVRNCVHKCKNNVCHVHTKLNALIRIIMLYFVQRDKQPRCSYRLWIAYSFKRPPSVAMSFASLLGKP